MLKRWAALPPGIRWLAGIAVILLALAVVWALFVPVADWLAHHDVGSVTGSLHETAVDNARGRLLTLGAGLFVAGALIFTARNFTLSREGQVTDRYTKAIEQLGSDKLDVRIGGIYALERVARDSKRDHPTVMEVLTAFIREHSLEQWPPPERGTDSAVPRTIRPDVQAAVTVVGRRDAGRDIRPIDLGGMGPEYARDGPRTCIVPGRRPTDGTPRASMRVLVSPSCSLLGCRVGVDRSDCVSAVQAGDLGAGACGVVHPGGGRGGVGSRPYAE
jgi:hypothetical protein